MIILGRDCIDSIDTTKSIRRAAYFKKLKCKSSQDKYYACTPNVTVNQTI